MMKRTFVVAAYLLFTHSLSPFSLLAKSSLTHSSTQESPALPREQCLQLLQKTTAPTWSWSFNTGNAAKKNVFRQIFASQQMKIQKFSALDVKEIDASPIDVSVFKASQFDNGVLVEDTSLDVEGAKIGVNVKWLGKEIPKLVGRKAKYRSLLSFRLDDVVFVYAAELDGLLTGPRGPKQVGFVFNHFFQPQSSSLTLSECGNNLYQKNTTSAACKVKIPPVLVVEKILKKDFLLCRPRLTSWRGAWQGK